MTGSAKNRKRLSKLVYKNIGNLFMSAEKLAKTKTYGPATHLMLAAREECVKWILLHCWDYIDGSIKKKVYRHEFKHEAVVVFYTLIAQVAVVEFSRMATKEIIKLDGRLAESFQLIALGTSSIFSVTDPQRIANQINGIFVEGDGQSHEIELMDVLRDDEDERQASIYVDFDSTLSETGGPHKLRKRSYEKYKGDVLLARYYVDRCAGQQPNISKLFRVVPTLKPLLTKLLNAFKLHIDEKLRSSRPSHRTRLSRKNGPRTHSKTR